MQSAPEPRKAGGRPTVWTAEKLAVAWEMYEGYQQEVATIAKVLGVSRALVYRALSASSPDHSRSLS